MLTLSPEELVALVRSVFPRFETDRVLAILVDVPRQPELDNPAWKERRRLAGEWHVLLQARRAEIPLDAVQLVAYPDVGSNNADLPAEGFLLDGPPSDVAAELERAGKRVSFEQIFAAAQLFLAPTEFSTTAPLKVAARRFGFRAATMPGFAASMIPALRLDYGEMARRVDALQDQLDAGRRSRLVLHGRRPQSILPALSTCATARPRQPGRFPEPAGPPATCPRARPTSSPTRARPETRARTAGVLPVEIDGEVVLFTIGANRAEAVEGEAAAGPSRACPSAGEPAYGNLAELGLGVLADFGLEPTGEILLDEKLGLHIAFGRSDHFGGAVGPKDFSSPSAVIHLDRIYIPQAQPRVAVDAVTLGYGDGRSETVMANGAYTIF